MPLAALSDLAKAAIPPRNPCQLLPPQMSYQLFYDLSEMINIDAQPPSDNQNTTPCEPDPRVAAALDEIGFAYEIDEHDACYYFLLDTGEGRSHGVIISSRTMQCMGAEVRAIYSICIESDEPLDPRTANLLLRENAPHTRGAWFISLQEGIHYAMFRVTVSATADAKTLGDWINMVARTADAMEKRLTGLDEL